eukprot:scaffold164_cov409-Prasinococcus_capsulatus_cf.AAC.7
MKRRTEVPGASVQATVQVSPSLLTPDAGRPSFPGGPGPVLDGGSPPLPHAGRQLFCSASHPSSAACGWDLNRSGECGRGGNRTERKGVHPILGPNGPPACRRKPSQRAILRPPKRPRGRLEAAFGRGAAPAELPTVGCPSGPASPRRCRRRLALPLPLPLPGAVGAAHPAARAAAIAGEPSGYMYGGWAPHGLRAS